MKAVGTRVLLKTEEVCEITTKIGEIVVKEKADYEKATVLSVGEEVREIKVDDKVLIYPNAGKKFKVEGEEYRLVSPSEVIVVL